MGHAAAADGPLLCGERHSRQHAVAQPPVFVCAQCPQQQVQVLLAVRNVFWRLLLPACHTCSAHPIAAAPSAAARHRTCRGDTAARAARDWGLQVPHPSPPAPCTADSWCAACVARHIDGGCVSAASNEPPRGACCAIAHAASKGDSCTRRPLTRACRSSCCESCGRRLSGGPQGGSRRHCRPRHAAASWLPCCCTPLLLLLLPPPQELHCCRLVAGARQHHCCWG
jgi:hypothetical protein